MIDLLRPDWPAPAQIRAFTTTRCGGVSTGCFAGLNLGDHVGDDATAVASNRALLRKSAQLPSEPDWLRQIHGNRCVQLAEDIPVITPEADAVVTQQAGRVCAILTADCLPVLLCDVDGSIVGAAHAGWRGLLDGVIENTVSAMNRPGARILAWLGPAIGPAAFEVGEEVRTAFTTEDAASAVAFTPRHGHVGKWLCDLYALAKLRLARVGVTQIYGADHCTYVESDSFYSYRRDGRTGRMASLIWIAPER